MEKQILYILILCFAIIIVVATSLTRPDDKKSEQIDLKKTIITEMLPEVPDLPKPQIPKKKSH
jgi:hypothetical protein